MKIIDRIATETSIEEIKIKKENLMKNQNTLSILREGFRLGLIEKRRISYVQTEIMYLLKDLIIRYTGGESSSIPIETGEKLLSSICYSIDTYCESLSSIEESIVALKTKDVKELYEKGIDLVKSYVYESRICFEKIKKNRLKIELQAYNDTIDEALPSFFRNMG